MNTLLLLADSSRSSNWIETIARPEILAFSIPIVALVGGAAYKIVQAVIVHRERMAKIEQGIDPDANPANISEPSQKS